MVMISSVIDKLLCHLTIKEEKHLITSLRFLYLLNHYAILSHCKLVLAYIKSNTAKSNNQNVKHFFRESEKQDTHLLL